MGDEKFYEIAGVLMQVEKWLWKISNEAGKNSNKASCLTVDSVESDTSFITTSLILLGWKLEKKEHWLKIILAS